jgi:hypothetical protein
VSALAVAPHRNDIVCIAEGTISGEGMQINIYAGIHELPT